jgi:signal peptidase I
VMGDNRNNSLDSRFMGFVSTDDILGKAYSVYFSLNDNDSITYNTGLLKSVRWNRISFKLK